MSYDFSKDLINKFQITSNTLHGYLPMADTDSLFHRDWDRRSSDVVANDISVIAEIEATINNGHNCDHAVWLQSITVLNMYYYEGFKEVRLYNGYRMDNTFSSLKPYNEKVTFPELVIPLRNGREYQFREFHLYPKSWDHIYNTLFPTLEEASFRVFGEENITPQFVINQDDTTTTAKTIDKMLYTPVEFTVREHRSIFRRHGELCCKPCIDAHIYEYNQTVLVDKVVPIGITANPYDPLPFTDPRIAYKPYDGYYNERPIHVKFPEWLALLDASNPEKFCYDVTFNKPMIFKFGYPFTTDFNQRYRGFHRLYGPRKRKDDTV